MQPLLRPLLLLAVLAGARANCVDPGSVSPADVGTKYCCPQCAKDDFRTNGKLAALGVLEGSELLDGHAGEEKMVCKTQCTMLHKKCKILHPHRVGCS